MGEQTLAEELRRLFGVNYERRHCYDIVQKLLDKHSNLSGDLYWKQIYAERSEAAAEITQLRAEYEERARKAGA